MIYWRKSSYSTGGGSGGTDCVELADLEAGLVGVRDSKNPRSGHLTLGLGELAGFVGLIKAGKLDLD